MWRGPVWINYNYMISKGLTEYGFGDSSEKIKEKTGISVKTTTLGYIQRGGSPNMQDRILAAKFGYKAVELLRDDKESCAVGVRNNKIITVPFSELNSKPREFDKNLYEIAHVLSL